MSRLLGFGPEGPNYNSFASNYQSTHYGGNTPFGGWFACCQRRGMSDGDEGGCCCCCTVLMFVIGAIFIGFGVLFCYYPDDVMLLEPAVYFNSAFIHLGFFQIDKIMIAAGFFMCLASICSCNSVCTAFFHFVAFIIIFVCIVIMSMSLNDFNNKEINNKIELNMREELRYFDPNKTSDNIWSLIQQDLECCGLSNSSDWQESTYYSEGTVPDSCCKNFTKTCGEFAGKEDLYQDGCLELFEDQVFSYFWVVVMLLTVCTIIGLLLSVLAAFKFVSMKHQQTNTKCEHICVGFQKFDYYITFE